jgi:hypothetical protein
MSSEPALASTLNGCLLTLLLISFDNYGQLSNYHISVANPREPLLGNKRPPLILIPLAGAFFYSFRTGRNLSAWARTHWKKSRRLPSQRLGDRSICLGLSEPFFSSQIGFSISWSPGIHLKDFDD